MVRAMLFCNFCYCCKGDKPLQLDAILAASEEFNAYSIYGNKQSFQRYLAV